MAKRVEVARVGGGASEPAAFIALRARSKRVVVEAKNGIDVARLLLVWTELGRDVALVCSFETRKAATSWVAGPVPALASWASLTCVPTGGDEAAIPDSGSRSSSVFALLRGAGGHVAPLADAAMSTKLVNTLTALNGECALARMLPSMTAAETWLLAPRLPPWLLSAGRGNLINTASADVVIVLSDDDSEDDDAAAAAFSRAARSLPPPPALSRTIFSRGSLRDGMLLPVSFQRHPLTGVVVRSCDQSKAAVSVNNASTSSSLTPPRRTSSSPAIESRVRRWSRAPSVPTASAGPPVGGTPRGTPPRLGHAHSTSSVGALRSAGPSLSALVGPVSLSSSLEPAKGGSGAPSSNSTLRGGLRTSSPTPLGRRPGIRPTPLNGLPRADAASASSARTCTPLPLSASISRVPPTKKRRLADAVPYDMARLAKSILKRKQGLFVTGGGGVGKTRLLHECVSEYRQAHGGLRVGLHVVAPTGVAAAAAGGVTLHAYLRLPAGCFDESLSEEDDAARLYSAMTAATKMRLGDTTILLLDEVSMVSSRMFTLLCYCVDRAHAKHNPDRPWRLLAFGDFFQLPPCGGGTRTSTTPVVSLRTSQPTGCAFSTTNSLSSGMYGVRRTACLSRCSLAYGSATSVTTWQLSWRCAPRSTKRVFRRAA